MVSVADIQKDLPDWPEDVTEQWLHYFANEPDCGWPPPEPLGDHRWGRLLGGRSLSWWKNVTWNRERVKCDLASFSPKARTAVANIVFRFNDGTDATTQRRVAQPWVHLRDNGVFPRALVAMRTPGGMILLDGSHRMAAFFLIQALSDRLERPTCGDPKAGKTIAFRW